MNTRRPTFAVWRRRIATAFAIGLLSLVIVIVAVRTAARGNASSVKAEELLPPTPPEWRINELAIGANEQVMKAVDELLNYDSATYRRYTAPDGRSFEIYLSYWSPAKQPPRLVAGHTPDICWVVNGWELVDNTSRPLRLAEALNPVKAHFRIFEHTGQPVAVFFWQMVGDEEANYTTVRENAWNRGFWAEIRARGLLAPAQAQLFIRVSSPKNWSAWESDPEFLKFVKGLGQLRPPA